MSDNAEPAPAGRSVRTLLASKRVGTSSPATDGQPDEWVVVYMDTVTLLLTFFVLMLMFANFEQPPLAAADGDQTGAVSVANTATSALGSSKPDDLRQLQSLISRRIQLSDLPEAVEAVYGEQVTAIRFADDSLFRLGSAELVPSGATLLNTLIPRLFVIARPISVEGHTDNNPLQGKSFASNRELSSARANAVVRFLEARGVPAKNLRSVGYGDTQPISSNQTPAGRAKNRRIELVIRELGAFSIAH